MDDPKIKCNLKPQNQLGARQVSWLKFDLNNRKSTPGWFSSSVVIASGVVERGEFLPSRVFHLLF